LRWSPEHDQPQGIVGLGNHHPQPAWIERDQVRGNPGNQHRDTIRSLRYWPLISSLFEIERDEVARPVPDADDLASVIVDWTPRHDRTRHCSLYVAALGSNNDGAVAATFTYNVR